jgi:YbbR domain-containing protein
LVAVLLWLFVVSERAGEVVLNIPVVLTDVAAGLDFITKPPAHVEVVISGPRILLARLSAEKLKICLNMRGATRGTVSFPQLAKMIHPGPELQVTGVYPAAIDISVAEAHKGN